MSSLGERFWSKVDRSQYSPGGCWVWLGGAIGKGYGGYSINRRARTAHRLAFLDADGTLTSEKPNALHVCHNRKCVNPAHIYAGNQKTNMEDAVKAGRLNPGGGRNAKKTHCPKGHPLSGENLYRYKFKNGLIRMCRRCRRTAAMAAYYRRKNGITIKRTKKPLGRHSDRKSAPAILLKEEYFGKPSELLARRGKKLNPLAQPIFHLDGTVFIPLNRSKWNRLYAKIDFEDFRKVAAFNWSAWFDPVANGYYAQTTDNKKHISMHRLVLGVSDPNIIVDHKYHDTLDDRKVSLQKTDMRGNAQNRKNNKDSIGVTWSRWNPSKWGSHIWVNGKARWLGFFKTKEEAAAAYQQACEIIEAATNV